MTLLFSPKKILSTRRADPGGFRTGPRNLLLVGAAARRKMEQRVQSFVGGGSLVIWMGGDG
jgi:hypothetical protein